MTSHCTQDGYFSIAVSRNVTSPPLLLNSVHLAFGNDHECHPVMATHAFVLFLFPFNSCGTTRWVRIALLGFVPNAKSDRNVLVTGREVWKILARKDIADHCLVCRMVSLLRKQKPSLGIQQRS